MPNVFVAMALELANQVRARLPANQRQPRSRQSLQESFVLFVNTTQRNVNLYWIDYQGRQTFYSTLRSQATAKVNTYRSHPWIFRDHRLGERMQVAHQNTYWPQPYLMRDPRNLGQWIPCRKQVLIHFPVRTLRETALWRIVSILADHGNKLTFIKGSDVAVETIDLFYIPRTLKTDLKFLLHAIENHRGILTMEASALSVGRGN